MSYPLERERVERLNVPEILGVIELAEKKLELEGTFTEADLRLVRFSISEGLRIARGAWHLKVPVKGEVLPPDDPSLRVIWEEDGRLPEKVEVKKGHYQISRGGDIRVVGLYDGWETRALSLEHHPLLYLKAAREIVQTLQVCKENPEAFFVTMRETYATLHLRINTPVSAT